MYRQFFGLRKDPFSMTPDPGFLMLTDAHREALAGLSYAVLSRKGFVVLTGDAGTGKTTLLGRLLQSIPASRAQFSVILNSTLTPSEFLELALMDFGLAPVPASKAQRLVLLQRFLTESHKQGKAPVLVVDEAHKLTPEVLEEIRLLTNFESAEGKLIQIVLAGQNELRDILNRADLRQLKQRVAVRLAIRPLTAPEVREYISYRWRKAGATQPQPFTSEAIEHIGQWSSGIPRLVNVICDNALVLAYGEGVATVGVQHIVEVAADLDLQGFKWRVNGAVRGAENPVQAKAPQTGTSAPPETPAGAPMPILERYAATPRPSRLMRWAGRLGLAGGTVRT